MAIKSLKKCLLPAKMSKLLCKKSWVLKKYEKIHYRFIGIAKVNIVFVLKEVRPEMELFLNNHLRCVKSLNAISKYIPNARLTIYLIFLYL